MTAELSFEELVFEYDKALEEAKNKLPDVELFPYPEYRIRIPLYHIRYDDESMFSTKPAISPYLEFRFRKVRIMSGSIVMHKWEHQKQ